MELKDIIANNIIEIRKENKMTQAELAEKLHYTDKAISKWERGESIPEIATLKQIAELFNCTVDVLLTENAVKEKKKYALPKNVKINRRIIAVASSLVIWIIAIIIFIYAYFYIGEKLLLWETFVWALPVNFILLFGLAKRWECKKGIPFVISGFLWSILSSLYVTTRVYETWMVFLLGIPLQALIILLSCLKR